MGQGRGEKVQEGRDTCTHTADPLCCTTLSNVTLQNNYTPIFQKVAAFGTCKKKKSEPKQAELTYAVISEDASHLWCGQRQCLEVDKVMFWAVGNVLFPDIGANFAGMFSL